MKERPILFSTPMVQAILEGRKTQTRRVVKPQPESINNNVPIPMHDFLENLKALEKSGLKTVKAGTGGYVFPDCPYGQVGDVLWVRESWCVGKLCDGIAPSKIPFGKVALKIHYLADGHKPHWTGKTRTSIHMPKAACRIFLKITNIRVERLQSISEANAKAEGVLKINTFEWTNYHGDGIPKLNASSSFNTLWQSINGEQSWNDNPWVWVIDFERIEKPS